MSDPEPPTKDSNFLWFNDPDYERGSSVLTISQLEKLGENLVAGALHKVNAWSNERIGPDMFRVRHVQALFNFAVDAIFAIKWMKKKCIKGGIAYYDDDGKFQWIEKLKDNHEQDK